MTRLPLSLPVYRRRLGEQELDSGVRHDEPDTAPEWIERVRALTAADAQMRRMT
jgi:hypothetical protein